MFFTEEDYRKIEKWLVSKGVMDTQFSSAAPLDGNETVAIVQNGKNVNTTIDALVEKLFLLGVDDFLNVTDKYEQPAIPLIQAISLIPFRHRRIGQVITFLNEDNKWVIYQFQGSSLTQWNNPTQWVNVIGSAITGELVPDEEDLTGIKEGDNTVLKFKNKAYSTANFSGLGRVYLRKNIAGGKNILTQQMINLENTRYILQYDYDLNGQTITIPEGCVIEFEGGSISNGILNGSDISIISNSSNIFSNVTLNLGLKEVNVNWFNDINPLQVAINSLGTTGTVFITENIIIPSTVNINRDNINIEGNNNIIYFNPLELSSFLVIKPPSTSSSYIRNIRLSNLIIQPTLNNTNIDFLIESHRVAQFSVNNVSLFGFNWDAHSTILADNGLYITEGMYHNYTNLYIQKFNNVGIKIDSGEFISTTLSINNSVVDQCSTGIFLEATNKMNMADTTIQSNSTGILASQSTFSHLSLDSCHFESNILDIKGGYVSSIGNAFWLEANDCLFIGPNSTPNREAALDVDWALVLIKGCSYPRNQYLLKYTDNLQEAIIIDFTYWEDRTSQEIYTGPDSKVGTKIKVFNQDISVNATPQFAGLTLQDRVKYTDRGYQLNSTFKLFKVGTSTPGKYISIPIILDSNINHSSIISITGYDAKSNNIISNSFRCTLGVGYSYYNASLNAGILNKEGFISGIGVNEHTIVLELPDNLDGIYMNVEVLKETPFANIDYQNITLQSTASYTPISYYYNNPDGTLVDKVIII